MTSEESNVVMVKRPRREVRKNGWTYPLHPLQFMAWFFFFYFLFTLFTLLIPNIPASCDQILCYTFGGLIFLIHFIIHILSVSANPADDGVTAKYDARRGSRIFPIGTFDKTKHEHVIENQFCYICEVSVSSKAKHCSVCNKCVQSFDHHCKWLNNCVGGKNYRLFLMCVVSAFFGSLVVFSVSITLVLSFFNPPGIKSQGSAKVVNGTFATNGTFSKGNTSKFVLVTSFGSSVDDSDHHVWISVVIITAILSTISFLLLGHLLLFHLYLYHNKLSTYDFIMKRRREQTESGDNNNEKVNDKKALLSTSYFFACCSTKIERMKRSRKVHDETNCKNFPLKKKKWFKMNIIATKRENRKHSAVPEENRIESVDGTINTIQAGLDDNSLIKRTSIDSPSIWSGTHGDVYIGSPERRVLEGREDGEGSNRNSSKAPLNKRPSNLSLQPTSASVPFTFGPILGSNHQTGAGSMNQRRASETATTSQRNFFNEHPATHGQLTSLNERQINSSDRNQLMSRLCDRSKSIQLDGSVLHKRMKRDPAKVQHQLIFRQKSIEQMINTQKLFHQLPGISRDGVKSRISNGQGSIFGDVETCDDNETNEVICERV